MVIVVPPAVSQDEVDVAEFTGQPCTNVMIGGVGYVKVSVPAADCAPAAVTTNTLLAEVPGAILQVKLVSVP
jgi:hypothetical protein